jgi:hypothetical protein
MDRREILRTSLGGTAALLAGGALAAERGPRIAIEEGRFTLDGRPTFLLGMSYYAGLGAPDALRERDLDTLRRRGFRWIRTWATWAAFGTDVSAVDAEGRPREPFLGRLQALLIEAGRRGMVVDVTLSRGNGATGPARLKAHADHRRAVETLVTALKSFPNWYLDLSNERNIRDPRYTSFEELKALRARVRELDPTRLVTASHGGDIDRDELRDYLQVAEVDFLTPHRPRGPESAAQTAAKSREYLGWMRELGRVVPLHYQEPFRRGYAAWQPQAEDYRTDLDGARAGAAAGWCFHNGDQKDGPAGAPRRSFDLSQKSLFDQLDADENRALELITG